MASNKKIQLEIDDDMTIEELKHIFVMESKLNTKPDMIRAFFSGAELKYGEKLYQHSIRNGITITMVVRRASMSEKQSS